GGEARCWSWSGRSRGPELETVLLSTIVYGFPYSSRASWNIFAAAATTNAGNSRNPHDFRSGTLTPEFPAEVAVPRTVRENTPTRGHARQGKQLGGNSLDHPRQRQFRQRGAARSRRLRASDRRRVGTAAACIAARVAWIVMGLHRRGDPHARPRRPLARA